LQTPAKPGLQGGFGFFKDEKKPGLRYRKPRLLLRENICGNSFFTSERVTCGAGPSAFARYSGLAPWNAQALAPFPQAFAAHAQLAGQFGLGHMILVFEDEVLEVVFQ
jgi:hypothetical protein